MRNAQPDQQCEEWAKKGECDVNEQYMNRNCASSCGVKCLFQSPTVQVVARGHVRTMKAHGKADAEHPNEELGSMVCREDAATCIPGERCPCDPRPISTDLDHDAGRGASSIVLDLLQERLSTRAAGAPTPRLLIVGLGTGLIPTTLSAALPHLGLVVDVIEIDENVVTAARMGFGFETNEGSVLVADAGEVVHSLLADSYDMVIVDCMVGTDGVGVIPPACYANSFAARLVWLLRPRGHLLAEWVWAHQREELLERLQSQERRFASVRSIPYVEAPWRRGDDTSDQCEAWAARGECVANRAFMVTKCPRSCYDRMAQADLKGQAEMQLNSWVVLSDA